MDDLSKTMAELPAARSKPSGFRRWKPALLAIAIPVGLAAVLWFVFREQLVRAVPVETGLVILLEQERGDSSTLASGSDNILFQASGWVEPDPWQINVAVKVDGFIEQVFIKEGEPVTNGQLVATLDPTDARLNLEVARANTRKHEAALAAQKNAANAAGKQAEAAQFRVEAAVARATGGRDIWERFSTTSSNVISLTERVMAKQTLIELEAEEEAARAALKALDAKTIEAQSQVGVAEAALASIRKQQEVAELALERTEIRTEAAGIILHRYVNPGDKRRAAADDPNSAIIASIYNPEQLQVRVDVPLAEAGKLIVGQSARIYTAMLPGRQFTGRVTRIIGQADLQRNTLQAKVALEAPDARLRPDVLCRVEFRDIGNAATANSPNGSGHALWIPERALDSVALEQTVWVVDSLSQTATERTIKLTSAKRPGFQQVADGLRANEVVVLTGKEALTEGARVKEVSE